jgi:hypothetical protein
MILNQMTYFQERIYVLSDNDNIRVYNTKPLELEYHIVFDNGERSTWGFYGSKPIVLIFRYEDYMTKVKFFDLEKNDIIHEFVVNEMIVALAIIKEDTYLCVTFDLNIFIFDDTDDTLTQVNNSAQSKAFLMNFSSIIYEFYNETDSPNYQRYRIKWIDPIPNTWRYIFRTEFCSYIFDLELREFIDIREYRILYAPWVLATEKYLFSIENTYNVFSTYNTVGTRVTRYDMEKNNLIIFKKVDTEMIFVCNNYLIIPFPKEYHWENYELAIYDIDTLELVNSFKSDELYEIENTSYFR